MAITAAETFDTLNPPVSILATDVDKAVLEIGQKGIYPVERVRQLPAQVLKRYFLRGSGSNSGCVMVRPELQKLITFMPLNLLDPVWPMKEHYDAIFCRNVMIYFDREAQKNILLKSRRQLKHDGLFFAGHSENLNYANELFHPCGRTVYRPRVACHNKQDETDMPGIEP